jgi:hypothetical protein
VHGVVWVALQRGHCLFQARRDVLLGAGHEDPAYHGLFMTEKALGPSRSSSPK